MKYILPLLFLCVSFPSYGQDWDHPAIKFWLINSTGQTGNYYDVDNGPLISHGIEVNVQGVHYTTNVNNPNARVFVEATGVPAYDIGPYGSMNNEAQNKGYVFRIPLYPTEETGAKTNVGLGVQGVFINGVAVFNYSDAMSYNDAGVWNQSAVYFENNGFDCAKGHPTGNGNYHLHQNPTAFDLDLVEMSDICTNHDSDGLYVIDTNAHSPLIGFARDGFPIYGAYAYANTDGTGGIKRIEPSYQLVTNGVGTRVDGPSYASIDNGAYQEDYHYVAGSGDLDEHNGRFAITPEYPTGTYAYYATVDENHNSKYPYIIGPTFYGEVLPGQFGSSTVPTDGVTEFDENVLSVSDVLIEDNAIKAYPNPVNDYAVLQVDDLLTEDLQVQVIDVTGKVLINKIFVKGRTICTLDTSTFYNGTYFVKLSNNQTSKTIKLIVNRTF